jgi:hypothetical protein
MNDSDQSSGVSAISVHKRDKICSLTSIWVNISYFGYYSVIPMAFLKEWLKTYTICSYSSVIYADSIRKVLVNKRTIIRLCKWTRQEKTAHLFNDIILQNIQQMSTKAYKFITNFLGISKNVHTNQFLKTYYFWDIKIGHIILKINNIRNEWTNERFFSEHSVYFYIWTKAVHVNYKNPPQRSAEEVA